MTAGKFVEITTVTVNEPNPQLPDDALLLLSFTTKRAHKMICIVAIYQKGQREVSVLLYGEEPALYFVHLMRIAHDIPQWVHFRENWPTPICVNAAAAAAAKSIAVTVNVSSHVKGKCQCNRATEN